eukprot:Gb_10575 [translate_table: standard]
MAMRCIWRMSSTASSSCPCWTFTVIIALHETTSVKQSANPLALQHLPYMSTRVFPTQTLCLKSRCQDVGHGSVVPFSDLLLPRHMP